MTKSGYRSYTERRYLRFFYITLAQDILVLALFVTTFTACIDEEDLVVRAAIFAENQDTNRDACTVEEVGRKTDDRIKEVEVFDNGTLL